MGGNTDVLLTEVGRGVRDAGGVFEIIPLKDGAIRECNGCHVCWTGKPCAKKDAMNELYPKIAASQGLVFGTPVYWYGPTALMKAFVDRFVYFNCNRNRPMIRGKAAALVIPYEEDSLDTAAPVIDFFVRSLSYMQMSLVGQVIAPGVTQRGEVKHKPALMMEAYTLGRRLAEPEAVS
jgi:multimeric flavodoxin WrbA